jgi:CarD family transcriptional regulator
MEITHETFSPGEKVMYPQFGLGTIAGVTDKQVNGTSFSFYRLEFPLKQIEILVPVKRASENGLRRVMSEQEVQSVLDYLSCAPPTSRPQQWHRWRKKTLEQLKSGNPLEMAKIFCYLNSLEGTKGLSFTERKILLQVERMLVSEVAVAMEVSEEMAEQIIAGRRNGNGTKPANGKGNGH